MSARRAEPLIYEHLDSPVGKLLVAGDADHVCLISFPAGSRARQPDAGWRRLDGHFASAQKELMAYFAGELSQFTFALRLIGTPFQQAVWRVLRTIPYGDTTTYGAIAQKIGKPKASRAVGAANGANPLPIVVPCHRVIGANSGLTGFGGGLDTKQFLLAHESAHAGR